MTRSPPLTPRHQIRPSFTDRLPDGCLPAIRLEISAFDLSVLDAAHVRPNIGNPVAVGIWFPAGF